MKETSVIRIQGAREHNLKNLQVDIPRNQFVVVTGVSGSGKSTLAFDLLFAEGQRRFLDAMNTYARQFVEQLARPDVDLIDGLPPTVSIEQRNSRGGGKSTVATVTEIYHFLRLLYARIGTQFCPGCQLPVGTQTRDQVGRQLVEEASQRGDLRILAPMIKNRKGFHSEISRWAAQQGFKEIRADGEICLTSEPLRLDRYREHNVEIVVGGIHKQLKARDAEAAQSLVDRALELGHGTVFALDKKGVLSVHSTERVCQACERSFEPLDPKMLSYNSPRGWCAKCRGFGELFYLPDVERGANAESIEESWFYWQEGEREPCPECLGTRLNSLARAVRLGLHPAGKTTTGKTDPNRFGPNLETVSAMSVQAAVEFFKGLRFEEREAEVARDILPEIRERLKFLNQVGLGYVQLGRGITTLSSGESQRIRLAAQLGSNLSGVLYVLDEPTIGLHPRDNEQLLDTLAALKARGNSLVVVEHDEATMRRADYIIDLGPGAGTNGGQMVAAGNLTQLMLHPNSLTGQCLRQTKKFPSRSERRPVAVSSTITQNPKSGTSLVLHHARRNNLKNLTVHFPLNRLIVVTGVSGSGKSTLIRECLLPALVAALDGKAPTGLDETAAPRVSGWEPIQRVYEVDQSPIGRTPRSIPATYVGFFDTIRQLFSQVPEARLRGYQPNRFSFNSAHGRCPTCDGAGVIKMEMNFLPPAFVRCGTCNGTRFNRETLDIEYHEKNIAQVLDLSVAEAIGFFSAIQAISRPLEALRDTGLDYVKLGQTSPTLSGGEAQRLKLVTHLLTGLNKTGPDLAKPGVKTRASNRPASLFLLEEPTIGLHSDDVRRLVEVLQRLVDAGHSVVVIEHNLELIAEADWIIDLGPEGGAEGGRLVVQGPPEWIVQNKNSHTGQFLRSLLDR